MVPLELGREGGGGVVARDKFGKGDLRGRKLAVALLLALFFVFEERMVGRSEVSRKKTFNAGADAQMIPINASTAVQTKRS